MTASVRVSEALFQTAVIEYAQLKGYLVHHTRPARTKDGWRTPIQGDKGFPDLCLVGHGRVIFIEVKSDSGSLTAEQRLWLAEIHKGGVETYVFRPGEWPDIEATL